MWLVLLSSIVVAVIGLVTGIIITVSGILNSFTEVSTSHADLIATGTELSPNAEHLIWWTTRGVFVFDTAEQPTKNLQDQACTIRDAHEKKYPQKHRYSQYQKQSLNKAPICHPRPHMWSLLSSRPIRMPIPFPVSIPAY